LPANKEEKEAQLPTLGKKLPGGKKKKKSAVKTPNGHIPRESFYRKRIHLQEKNATSLPFPRRQRAFASESVLGGKKKKKKKKKNGKHHTEGQLVPLPGGTRVSQPAKEQGEGFGLRGKKKDRLRATAPLKEGKAKGEKMPPLFTLRKSRKNCPKRNAALRGKKGRAASPCQKRIARF